jgi:hypothetical protein
MKKMVMMPLPGGKFKWVEKEVKPLNTCICGRTHYDVKKRRIHGVPTVPLCDACYVEEFYEVYG